MNDIKSWEICVAASFGAVLMVCAWVSSRREHQSKSAPQSSRLRHWKLETGTLTAMLLGLLFGALKYLGRH